MGNTAGQASSGTRRGSVSKYEGPRVRSFSAAIFCSAHKESGVGELQHDAPHKMGDNQQEVSPGRTTMRRRQRSGGG